MTSFKDVAGAQPSAGSRSEGLDAGGRIPPDLTRAMCGMRVRLTLVSASRGAMSTFWRIEASA